MEGSEHNGIFWCVSNEEHVFLRRGIQSAIGAEYLNATRKSYTSSMTQSGFLSDAVLVRAFNFQSSAACSTAFEAAPVTQMQHAAWCY